MHGDPFGDHQRDKHTKLKSSGKTILLSYNPENSDDNIRYELE